MGRSGDRRGIYRGLWKWRIRDGGMNGSGMRVRQPRIMIVGIMRLMVNGDYIFLKEKVRKREIWMSWGNKIF